MDKGAYGNTFAAPAARLQSLSSIPDTLAHVDNSTALRASRTAGWATLAIGIGLVTAPHLLGSLGGLTDPRTARAIGLVDLALVPGLLAGAPRWPWLTARAAANVGTAAVLARQGGGTALTTAAALAVLTVVDGAAARRLHADRS